MPTSASPSAAPREVGHHRLAVQLGPFASPRAAVSSLVAVQAQDHLASLWAIGLRVADSTEADVERSIGKDLIRTWPLRGTLHLVAADDARWLLELVAPKTLAGAAKRFRDLGLDDAAFSRARKVLEPALATEALTRPEVYARLESVGLDTSKTRGLHVLFRLAQERFLCFGPRVGSQPTFTLFDRLVPAHQRRRTREEALAELATRYFAGHGPATTADFTWWSGLSAADARHAISAAQLGHEDLDGERLWLAGTPSPRSEVVCLLPPFDEFIVAFKNRHHVVDDPRHVNQGGNGILSAVIVAGGRVVGTWKRTLSRRGVSVHVSGPVRAGYSVAVERYAQFLGRPLLSAK